MLTKSFLLTAQLVGVKGLSQQALRGASPMNTAGGSIQLLSTIQRPRTVPIAASPFNAKQLTARGIGQTQRNFQISSMKLGSPISGTFTIHYYSYYQLFPMVLDNCRIQSIHLNKFQRDIQM